MKIFKLDDGVYFADDYGVKVTGTLSELFKFLVNRGYAFSEVEMAITEMQKKDHNVASFGTINRMFMYTSELEIESGVA